MAHAETPEITPEQAEADHDFEDFWRPLLSGPDGALDMAKVREELAVWHFVMGEVGKVYCHITGDRLSKPNYRAETVIGVFDDLQSEEQREALREAFDWIAGELRQVRGGHGVDFFAEQMADMVGGEWKERYCGKH